MAIDPSISVFTTLDISAPADLLRILRSVGQFLNSTSVVFLDERGRPSSPFHLDREEIPDQTLAAWQRGGVGFRPVEYEGIEAGAQWYRFNVKAYGYSQNQLMITAPQSFWDSQMHAVSQFMAETVHAIDASIGALLLPGVALWRGSLGPLGGLISVPQLVCFGSPYIELFGLEKLLTAPVFKAQKHFDNAAVLQLFESTVSPQSDQWQAMQRELRQHLGPRRFRDPNDKPGRSLMFSIDEVPKLLRATIDLIRDSTLNARVKSASSETVEVPQIDWDRMRR